MKVKTAGKAIVRGLLLSTALVGGSILAYKLIFNRPGEAAINLLPSDCVFVMTLDTNPSERQAVTFNNINKWMKEAKIAETFDDQFGKLFKQSKVGEQLRPFIAKSFAVGVWMSDNKQPNYAWLISVSDAGQVRSILETAGQPETGSAAVVDNYLIYGDSKASIDRIQRVRDGNEKPISILSTYAEARQALPADANLMVFADAGNMAKLMDNDRKKAWDKNVGAGFMSLGVTVDADGVSFDWNSELESKNPELQKILAESTPMDMASLSQLPSGAYGVMGLHRLDRYYRAMRISGSDDREAQKKMEEGFATLTRETGLDMERDIVPILEGEFVVGVYPGANSGFDDPDVLTKVSVQDPDKVLRVIEAASAAVAKKSRNGKPLQWEQTVTGDATIYTLTPESERAHNTSKQSITAPTEPGAMSFDGSPNTAAMMKRPEPKLKAPGYVQIKDGFLFGSSKAILMRGLAAARGTGTLGSTASFQALLAHNIANTEGTVIVNLYQIMKSVTQSMADPSGRPNPDLNPLDLELLFGDESTGLVVSGRYEKSVASGRLFVPIDYERAIRLIGKQAKDMSRGNRAMTQ